jgi:hypothetical protein
MYFNVFSANSGFVLKKDKKRMDEQEENKISLEELVETQVLWNISQLIPEIWLNISKAVIASIKLQCC